MPYSHCLTSTKKYKSQSLTTQLHKKLKDIQSVSVITTVNTIVYPLRTEIRQLLEVFPMTSTVKCLDTEIKLHCLLVKIVISAAYLLSIQS